MVSGGLTWTNNNTTVPGGQSKWYAANEACNKLTAQGLRAGTWRLPTRAELLALQAADSGALKDAGWTMGFVWSSTANNNGEYYFVGMTVDRGYADNGSISCNVTCVH